MLGKRLALGALAVCAIALLGGPAGTSAQPQPGVSGSVYGGTKGEDTAWLWVDPTGSIIALEIPYAISRSRCTNRQGYFSYVLTGAFYFEPVRLRPDRSFRTLVVDRYREGSRRLVERVTVAGRIADDRAVGTVSGSVRIARPNRPVARCTFGPQRWTLFN